MDLNSPSEPTQVISMLGQYHSQLRHSTSGSRLSMSNTTGKSIKRSLATRLAFDETMEPEPSSARKLSRLDPTDHGLRRFTSENIDAMSSLQKDNHEMRQKLKEMEAIVAGSKAQVASMESKVRNLELEKERDRVEFDRVRGALERDKQDSRDKIDNYKCKLKQVKQRESDRLEEGYRSRKSSIDRTAELDMKVAKLRADKEQLEEELLQSKMSLSNKPDIDKIRYNEQIQEFKRKISDLENKELYLNTELQRMEKKKVEGEEAVLKLEEVKNQLKMERLRGDRLEGELDANKEAVIQRKVMKEKLEKYDDLENENIRLRSTNKLLTETAENSALLKEKVKQMENDRKRMEARCLQMNEISAELEVVKNINKEWSLMVRDWVQTDVGEVTVLTAKNIVRSWQERELSYVEQVSNLQHKEKDLQSKLTSETASRMKLETDISKVKHEQEEQARLVKKLQRKLLLVTKERDSFKGILDSYESEMTVTEDNLYQDKINALEKTIQEYKAIVEMLEEDKKEASPRLESVNQAEVQEWKNRVQNLEEKNEKLELELERRAIKGDFNPTDTKVLHFVNNPTAVAVEKRAAELGELLNENNALKTRIKLLEEGQTKDLTIMVGAKVEEGEGEKIKDLKKEIESNELKNKRLMEAFSKTSQEFREVVAKLTGYSIKKMSGDNIYALKPKYADNAEDNLLFQAESDGEISMLESDFSLELGELMEEHLEKENSIPMFLAGLIRKLYNRRHGVSEEDVEEYNDGDDDDDEEEDDRESSSGRSKASSQSDEIIEIDDD